MSSVLFSAPVAHPHVVQFYEGDAFLIDALERFVSAGFSAREPLMLIATEPHRRQLEARLSARGIDVAVARKRAFYQDIDAAETLARLMPAGEIDAQRFSELVEPALARAAGAGSGRMRAFGEMVALLLGAGNLRAAVQLEELWGRVARARDVTVLCAYPIDQFSGPDGEGALLEICDRHTVVRPAESFARLETPARRAQSLAELQRRARVLEAEIAQRAASEAALRRARDEAEAASLAKDEFLAMLGHELRNPLSAVRNAVEAARFDPLRRDRALEIARRGVDQLARLVDDLLDVARITQGRITLRRKRTSVAGVLQRGLEAAWALVEERGHALVLTLPEPDVHVEGDSARLEQVVANLVSNAAKYTNLGGHIEVGAALEGREVVLRVRDDGIGVAPELRERVFDLFVQGDRGLDRAQGGLGIGLTVVRRLVELHGGAVEVHSDGLDQGSEFVVRLPASATPRTGVSPSPEAAADACADVLVVEDNDYAAESLTMLLERAGHRVRVVASAPQALAAIRAARPDIVLADVGLPGMDGYELARRIRAAPDLAQLLLVALTGYGREEDRERALAAGFDHHLVKPVEPDELQLVVARAARSRA